MADSENTNGTAAPEQTPEQVDAQVQEALTKDASENASPTPEQSFGGSLLMTALQLRKASRDLTAQTTANREMLRNLAKTGALTETQASAVAVIYPNRERKPRAGHTTPDAPTTPNGNPGVAVKAKPAARS